MLRPRDRRPAASVRLIEATEAERVPRTGAVRSVQEAEVTLPGAMLTGIWKPEYLERLARAYWRHVTRATLGLVRIVYTPTSRAAVLLNRRLPLLRFGAPEYETSETVGCVTWRIDRGLLVASEGRGEGFLRIRVERRRPAGGPDADPEPGDETLAVQVEVRNFYPWLRGSGPFARFGAWLYGQTQLRIHVLLCNAFLRSLARLDLPPVRPSELPGEIEAGGGRRFEGAPPGERSGDG